MTITFQHGTYGNGKYYLEIRQDGGSNQYCLISAQRSKDGTLYGETRTYYGNMESVQRAYSRKRRQYILQEF